MVEPSCGCSVPSLGPLEEQQSFRSPALHLKKKYLCLCVHMCMSEGALKYQKRVWDSLKLVLQGAVNSPLWELRPELRPSARAANALNH